MSEQDASEGEEPDDTTDASEAEDDYTAGGAPPNGEGDGDSEELEDIAEEPAADADERLADIVAEAVEAGDLDVDFDPADGRLDGELVPEEVFEPGEVEVGEPLVERVAEADPETVAREIATLQLRVAALEGETADLREQTEDLESRLARKQADFQNYKQRQQRKLEAERERATEALVERLLDVRDNLARALDQDEDADIRGGVESTLRQFDEELARENVEQIEPNVGGETDPQRHEVLMRVESDQPEGTVADLHRPGYEMAGKVLRPAQVTVSDGGDADEGGASGQGDE